MSVLAGFHDLLTMNLAVMMDSHTITPSVTSRGLPNGVTIWFNEMIALGQWTNVLLSKLTHCTYIHLPPYIDQVAIEMNSLRTCTPLHRPLCVIVLDYWYDERKKFNDVVNTLKWSISEIRCPVFYRRRWSDYEPPDPEKRVAFGIFNWRIDVREPIDIVLAQVKVDERVSLKRKLKKVLADLTSEMSDVVQGIERVDADMRKWKRLRHENDAN